MLTLQSRQVCQTPCHQAEHLAKLQSTMFVPEMKMVQTLALSASYSENKVVATGGV